MKGTNYCQVQAWKSFVYISITKHPFEGHEISITKATALIWKWKVHFFQFTQFGSWFLKTNITRFTFLHRGACMHQRQESQRDTHKLFSTLKLPLCGLVVFIDMNTYILTGGRSFKTLLKENYAIALDSCYLFTKNC